MVYCRNDRQVNISRPSRTEFLLTTGDKGVVIDQVWLDEYSLLQLANQITDLLMVKHANDDIDGR